MELESEVAHEVSVRCAGLSLMRLSVRQVVPSQRHSGGNTRVAIKVDPSYRKVRRSGRGLALLDDGAMSVIFPSRTLRGSLEGGREYNLWIN